MNRCDGPRDGGEDVASSGPCLCLRRIDNAIRPPPLGLRGPVGPRRDRSLVGDLWQADLASDDPRTRRGEHLRLGGLGALPDLRYQKIRELPSR